MSGLSLITCYHWHASDLLPTGYNYLLSLKETDISSFDDKVILQDLSLARAISSLHYHYFLCLVAANFITLFYIFFLFLKRSLEDEINRTTAEDIPIFMISYAVIFVYIAVALGEYSSCKRLLVRLWKKGLDKSVVNTVEYFSITCHFLVAKTTNIRQNTTETCKTIKLHMKPQFYLLLVYVDVLIGTLDNNTSLVHILKCNLNYTKILINRNVKSIV